MINSNSKAKNIIVRALTKKDNEMLMKLKHEFRLSFNNDSVMKASYGYLERGEELKKINQQLRKAELDRDKTLNELNALKVSVKGYVSFLETHLRKVTKLSAVSVSKTKTKTVRKKYPQHEEEQDDID